MRRGETGNNEVFPPVRDLREVLARCGVPARDHGSPSFIDEI